MHKVFSVRDDKAMAFMQPFFCVTRGVAFRMFYAACIDSSHDFHKYAEDYALYEIGEWDDTEPRLTQIDPPDLVVRAIDCIAAEKGSDNVRSMRADLEVGKEVEPERKL